MTGTRGLAEAFLAPGNPANLFALGYGIATGTWDGFFDHPQVRRAIENVRAIRIRAPFGSFGDDLARHRHVGTKFDDTAQLCAFLRPEDLEAKLGGRGRAAVSSLVEHCARLSDQGVRVAWHVGPLGFHAKQEERHRLYEIIKAAKIKDVSWDTLGVVRTVGPRQMEIMRDLDGLGVAQPLEPLTDPRNWGGDGPPMVQKDHPRRLDSIDRLEKRVGIPGAPRRAQCVALAMRDEFVGIAEPAWMHFRRVRSLLMGTRSREAYGIVSFNTGHLSDAQLRALAGGG